MVISRSSVIGTDPALSETPPARKAAFKAAARFRSGMSEKKKSNVKAEEKLNFFQKVLRFFTTLPARVARPFKNMWRELKKVTWPTRKDLLNYTLIVLAFMVFMGVVIGLLDMGSSRLIALMIG